MKEDRFIELLNLYVDQELAPGEAAELEAEIARNPVRRRTYEQYCRMHRACAVLFESSRAQAPEYRKLAEAARAADEKVVYLPVATSEAKRPFWRRAAWGGGLALAAAAAVAVVVLREPPAAAPQGTAPAIAQSSSPAAPTSAPAATAARPSDYQLVAFINRDAGRSFTVQPVATPDAGWMQELDLPPFQRVTAENLRFGSEPVAPDANTFRGRQPYYPEPGSVEFSAFQFQK